MARVVYMNRGMLEIDMDDVDTRLSGLDEDTKLQVLGALAIYALGGKSDKQVTDKFDSARRVLVERMIIDQDGNFLIGESVGGLQ